MTKKRFILSVCCLLFISFNQIIAAETIRSIDESWTANTDRSLVSSPSITKEGHTLFIYSDEPLEDLHISITTEIGTMVYEETSSIPSDTTHLVSIDALPVGNYYIVLVHESKYMVALFTK